jgi:3-methyladenine DNA glycosylase AlkC
MGVAQGARASMAEQLKHFYDERVVRSIASDLLAVHPSFRAASFIEASLTGLTELELTARAWHLAHALYDHLPRPFPQAARILVDSLGPEHAQADSFGLEPFRYLPHVFFVQKYGLQDFEASMHAQYELTKRFSAESSIRAFLVEHPDATLARLTQWSNDPNPHVRRLVSEGTRPRLPWAPRLRAFVQDPSAVLALLETLKDDSERYVQRSVANNLNDIGKDHPDLVVATCRRWLRAATPGRSWIVNHALRSLVKKGHRGALTLLGVGQQPRLRIRGVRLSAKSVSIGETLRFSVQLESESSRAQRLAVDYAVHFIKADGKPSPKVFKLKRTTLASRATSELRGSVSLAQMSTRKVYPGRHRLELLVNGVAYPLADFAVVATLAG